LGGLFPCAMSFGGVMGDGGMLTGGTRIPSRMMMPIPMVEGSLTFIKEGQVCFNCPQRMCRSEKGDMGRWYLKGTVKKFVKKTKWPKNKLKDEVEAECRRMHCNPLCLKYTWDCTIDARGDMKEAGFKWYNDALCSQFIAHACSKVWKCCDFFDPMIWKWVEARSFDKFNVPLLPIPACVHNPVDKKFEKLLCAKCQGSVIVNFKVHPEWCYMLASEGGGGQYLTPGNFAKPGDASGGNAGAETSEEVNKYLTPLLLHDLGHAGPHRSLFERCRCMTLEIYKQLGAIIPKYNERACECLGCCKPKDSREVCYFPMTQPI